MHPALLRLRIHFLVSRCKDYVAADLSQQFAVAFEGPWVLCKVLVRRELELVNEYTRSYQVAALTGNLHEG